MNKPKVKRKIDPLKDPWSNLRKKHGVTIKDTAESH
jgi:hypothetical protein